MSNILETTLGPLVLKNPVIVASGTFGYGLEYSDVMDISKIGGISVKGISLLPRPGNPPPGCAKRLRACSIPSVWPMWGLMYLFAI